MNLRTSCRRVFGQSSCLIYQKKWLLATVFSIFCCNNIMLAQPQDSIDAAYWVGEALRCREQQKLDSFQFFVEKSIKIYQKSNRIDWWLRTSPKLAYHQSDKMKQPFEAIQFLQEVRKNLWRQPNNRIEWQALTQNYLASGYIAYYGVGNVELCNKFYEEAYQIFKEKLDEDNDKIAQFLFSQLANTYTRLGEYKKAEQLFLKSIQYWNKKQQPENIRYSDLAIVYNDLQQFDKSLAAIEKGFQYANSDKIRHYLYDAKINALFQLKRFKEIEILLTEYEKLIEKVRKNGNDSVHGMLSSLYGFRARLYYVNRKLNLAEASFQKSIENEIIFRKKENCREVAKIRFQYANFLLETLRNAEALQQYQKMLVAVLPQFRPSDDFQQPLPEHFFAENVIFEAIEGKSRVFEKMGKLEEAFACLELIPEVEARLRQTFSYELSALHSLRESRERYERAIELAWQLFERDGNPKWAARAFVMTEQARGVLLLQSLAQVQRDIEAVLPAAELEKLQHFRAKTAWLECQIAEAQSENLGTEKLHSFESQLFNLKIEEQKFINKLKKEHPRWASAQARAPFLKIEEVPRLLREGQIFVSYFLTERSMFIFQIQRNGKSGWRRVLLPADFRENVLSFVQKLTHPGTNEPTDLHQFEAETQQFFKVLLAPEIAQTNACNALLLVPDDVLVFLPFEVLTKSFASPPATRWRDVEFLIKRFSINYAYSATLFKMQQQIAARPLRAKKYCAAFAPSYHQPPDSIMQGILAERVRGGAYDLKGTHEEVRKLEQRVGAVVFDGAVASEQTFKKVAPEYQILHLAMHAVANESAPELSKLLFGDPRADSLDDDNLLYANELQALRFSAGLAVLSACHTGFGKIYRGEGVYSLARAFAVAGVPATVMSLWRLPDHTAPILMEKFYEHLAAGKEKDEALQLAKIDFLQTDSLFYFNHPYFWAGLMTNGASVPLPISTGFSAWWWLIGCSATLMIWLIFNRLRKSSWVAPSFF